MLHGLMPAPQRTSPFLSVRYDLQLHGKYGISIILKSVNGRVLRIKYCKPQSMIKISGIQSLLVASHRYQDKLSKLRATSLDRIRLFKMITQPDVESRYSVHCSSHTLKN
jgi:hypothetical protein